MISPFWLVYSTSSCWSQIAVRRWSVVAKGRRQWTGTLRPDFQVTILNRRPTKKTNGSWMWYIGQQKGAQSLLSSHFPAHICWLYRICSIYPHKLVGVIPSSLCWWISISPSIVAGSYHIISYHIISYHILILLCCIPWFLHEASPHPTEVHSAHIEESHHKSEPKRSSQGPSQKTAYGFQGPVGGRNSVSGTGRWRWRCRGCDGGEIPELNGHFNAETSSIIEYHRISL